jgi:transcriptional activator of cad operon
MKRIVPLLDLERAEQAMDANTMEDTKQARMLVGEWTVDRVTGEISRGSESSRLDLRSLRLLLALADPAPQVVSIDELLNQVWPEVTVAPDSVYQAVKALRRQLSDNSKQPIYIESLPRIGYRMIAPVSCLPEPNSDQQPVVSASQFRRRIGFLGIGLASLILILALSYTFANKRSSARATALATNAIPQKSIAVLPLLDLTGAMDEEPFADGLTEELIDKLSKVPDFHVASPTSSFFYKDKKIPIAEIAHTLGVSYVLDGSVRKSGSQLRVSARLVRGDNGYVIWTESYDRPYQDRLALQDEIANKVANALTVSSSFTH